MSLLLLVIDLNACTIGVLLEVILRLSALIKVLYNMLKLKILITL